MCRLSWQDSEADLLRCSRTRHRTNKTELNWTKLGHINWRNWCSLKMGLVFFYFFIPLGTFIAWLRSRQARPLGGSSADSTAQWRAWGSDDLEDNPWIRPSRPGGTRRRRGVTNNHHKVSINSHDCWYLSTGSLSQSVQHAGARLMCTTFDLRVCARRGGGRRRGYKSCAAGDRWHRWSRTAAGAYHHRGSPLCRCCRSGRFPVRGISWENFHRRLMGTRIQIYVLQSPRCDRMGICSVFFYYGAVSRHENLPSFHELLKRMSVLFILDSWQSLNQNCFESFGILVLIIIIYS